MTAAPSPDDAATPAPLNVEALRKDFPLLTRTVNGIADNEDVDYYVVEAKKGERISAEVEGLRLGISEFDPYVAILDSKRFELGVSDDAALAWRYRYVNCAVGVERHARAVHHGHGFQAAIPVTAWRALRKALALNLLPDSGEMGLEQ